MPTEPAPHQFAPRLTFLAHIGGLSLLGMSESSPGIYPGRVDVLTSTTSGRIFVVGQASRSPNGHRAPEAVQDLVFDAVADVRAQLTGPRPPLETVTTGTLWSLVRQPVTRHDDPERTHWTSCRGCRECCSSWRPPPAAPTTAPNGNHEPHAYQYQRRPRRPRRPRLPKPGW